MGAVTRVDWRDKVKPRECVFKPNIFTLLNFTTGMFYFGWGVVQNDL